MAFMKKRHRNVHHPRPFHEQPVDIGGVGAMTRPEESTTVKRDIRWDIVTDTHRVVISVEQQQWPCNRMQSAVVREWVCSSARE